MGEKKWISNAVYLTSSETKDDVLSMEKKSPLFRLIAKLLWKNCECEMLLCRLSSIGRNKKCPESYLASVGTANIESQLNLSV